MKKKILSLGLILVLLCSMSGCGQNITLNSEENDLIAEYVAGVMLKYSHENKWEYEKVKRRPWQNKGEDATEAPTTQQNQSSIQQNTVSSSGSTNVNGDLGGNYVKADTVNEALEQAFAFSGVEVEYKSFVVAENYPEGDYLLSVKANEDCKVFALQFDLKNVNSEAVTLNTVSTSVAMKLSMGGTVITQSASLLNNDLMGLKNVTINAGDTYSAVAIFQVPESVAFNTSNMNISVYVNGNSVGQVLGL